MKYRILTKAMRDGFVRNLAVGWLNWIGHLHFGNVWRSKIVEKSLLNKVLADSIQVIS